MSVPSRILMAAALVLAGGPPVAQAAGEEPRLFEFDAFGTLGVVHSSEDQADFTRNVLVPFGAGASEQWSLKVDSVLAGQVTAHVTPALTAVVQVVAEHRPGNSFRPRVEWANVRYAVTPELTVGVGRIVSPILMLTDTRRLSFALPWIRPPVEVYDLYPVPSNEGVDAIWTTRIADAIHVLELSYGRSDVPYERNGRRGVAQARKQFILRSTLERGNWQFHAGYSPAKLSLPQYQPLFDAFRQFGDQGEAIASGYEMRERSTRYIGTGFTWDPGRWFVRGEWANVDFGGVLRSRGGWYASAGLRLGDITPYVVWAKAHATERNPRPALDLAGLSPEAAQVASLLNAQLDATLEDVPRQSTLSAGLRWDMWRNLVLKAQFDHVDLAPGSAGTLSNIQPGFIPGGSVNLLGVSVSFVL